MPAFKTPRVPKSFLGVTIASDVAMAVAEFCAEHGLSKSLYTEVALRRSLSIDAPDAGATPTLPSPPLPSSQES